MRRQLLENKKLFYDPRLRHRKYFDPTVRASLFITDPKMNLRKNHIAPSKYYNTVGVVQ